MELLVIFAMAWAVKGAWEHVKADYRRSRTARIAEVAKTHPEGKLPKHRQAAVARHHAAGYWTGEILHGLPVTRTGLHAGWISHKTARRRAEEARSEAQAAHAETEASVLARLRDHHDRQMQAHREMEAVFDEGTPGQPSVGGTPRGRAQTAANIADYRRRRAEAEGNRDAAPPLPSDAVAPFGPHARPADDPGLNDSQRDRDRNGLGTACAACGRQGTEDDPLLIDEDGFRVHHDCTLAQRQYAAAEEAAMAESPSPHDTDEKTEPPATDGGIMTATAETTYDEQLATADQVIARCEQRLAELEAERLGDTVEHLVSACVDPASVSSLTDAHDAIQQEIKSTRQTMDSMQAYKANLIRTHQAGAEYHQGTANGGAERTFFAN